MKIWNSEYKTLDHWRGIAALWVMVFHGFATTYDKPSHPFIEPIKLIAANGWLGVHIFFVISGYCITSSAYKLIIKDGTPGNFIKSRALRLLPVYWIAFLFTIVINLLASPFNNTGFWSNLPDSWQSWLGNVLLIQPYINIDTYVVVYWSLVVEFAFYLLVTGLLIARKSIGKTTAIFIGLSLGFASPFIYVKNISFWSFWGEFVCGGLLFAALLFKFQKNTYRQKISLWLILAMGLVGIGANYFYNRSNQLWLSAIFSIILYYLYSFDSQISKSSKIKWLRSIGLFSYSLYLLHVPIEGRIINLGSRFIPPESLFYLMLQIVGWVAAIIISYIFYRLIEKPINIWRCQYLLKTNNTRIHNKLSETL